MAFDWLLDQEDSFLLPNLSASKAFKFLLLRRVTDNAALDLENPRIKTYLGPDSGEVDRLMEMPK